MYFAWYVQDAQKADAFVVAARDQGVTKLYLVRAEDDGVTLAPEAIVDLTRDQASLNLSGAAAIEIANDATAAIATAAP